MELINKAYDGIESVLPMEGPFAIPARAVIGAGLGYLVIAAVRPSFAYTPEGTARTWAVMPELYKGGGEPTFLPFFVGPLVGAVLLAGFI